MQNAMHTRVPPTIIFRKLFVKVATVAVGMTNRTSTRTIPTTWARMTTVMAIRRWRTKETRAVENLAKPAFFVEAKCDELVVHGEDDQHNDGDENRHDHNVVLGDQEDLCQNR